jgi:hypothetical protein
MIIERKSACLRVQHRFSLPAIVALLVSCLTWNASVAQDDADAQDDPNKKPDVEMLKCNVKVVDPDGHPVEDATVYCTGLRSREDPGSGHLMFWLMKMKIKTDENGIATMSYPKMIGADQTTGKLTWSVEHPDFANYRDAHSVDDDPAEITLQRGFRIALTAKRASSGENIKKNLYVIASFAGGGKWDLKKNGTLVSATMKQQDGILRVVCFEEGKPTLFSDEIEVKPGDKSRVMLRDIELKAGCRIEGKLADSVERPVKNGYVIASINKTVKSVEGRAIWHWSDEATVEPDGTFVFDSLPMDEVVQMIPICDGWVPAKPKAEDVVALLSIDMDIKRAENLIKQFDATPQLTKTEGKRVSSTLEMVNGPTLTIEVTDEDGQPLKGISLGTSPNQFWFNSGSQILGESMATRKAWELREQNVDLTNYYQSTTSPYRKKTDETGSAVFKNMPHGTHDFYVFGKGLEMSKESETGDRTSTRVTIEAEDQKLTIKMRPKQE